MKKTVRTLKTLFILSLLVALVIYDVVKTDVFGYGSSLLSNDDEQYYS